MDWESLEARISNDKTRHSGSEWVYANHRVHGYCVKVGLEIASSLAKPL